MTLALMIGDFMTAQESNLHSFIEGIAGIFVIRNAGNVRSWNNIQYKPGLSAKNVPAKKLSMNVATIPPGGVPGAPEQAFWHLGNGNNIIYVDPVNDMVIVTRWMNNLRSLDGMVKLLLASK